MSLSRMPHIFHLYLIQLKQIGIVYDVYPSYFGAKGLILREL
jgi:hypothetical protein